MAAQKPIDERIAALINELEGLYPGSRAVLFIVPPRSEPNADMLSYNTENEEDAEEVACRIYDYYFPTIYDDVAAIALMGAAELRLRYPPPLIDMLIDECGYIENPEMQQQLINTLLDAKLRMQQVQKEQSRRTAAARKARTQPAQKQKTPKNG